MAAIAKLNTARTKVAALCHPSQTAGADAEQAALFDEPSLLPKRSLDVRNADAYSDSTSGALLGTDDAGWVPASKDNLKCATMVDKALGKLVTAVTKCHIKTNDALFKGKPFVEEDCENAAVGKYNKQRDKLVSLGICPSGVDSASLDVLSARVTTEIDGANGNFYPCDLGP